MNNPLDELDNPQVRQSEYWGQVAIDAYYAVLEKGVGKVAFNPQLHSVDKRVTALDVKLVPLGDMNITFDVSRSMIAESREYAGVVLPSIKAMGIAAKDLNGKWVRLTFAATGRTYIDKNGDTKDSTTVKFLQLFADEAACRADYLATHQPGTTLPADSTPAPAPAPANNKERETALKFLKVFVDNAAKGQIDLGVIQRTLASNISMNPIVAKHFTADSTEAMTLIAEAMSK